MTFDSIVFEYKPEGIEYFKTVRFWDTEVGEHSYAAEVEYSIKTPNFMVLDIQGRIYADRSTNFDQWKDF